MCEGKGLDSYDVLDVLSQLIAKSLVLVEQDSGSDSRYRLLESMRIYGTERLAEAGESEDVRDRHAIFFLQMAAKSETEFFTAQQPASLIRLERDYDNFRAAMTGSMDSDDKEIGLKIASSLTLFWVYHRHVGDGQDWLERAVQHSEGASPAVRGPYFPEPR